MSEPQKARFVVWACHCGGIVSTERPFFHHADCCDSAIRERTAVLLPGGVNPYNRPTERNRAS
jgi:hypothetical protein